MGFVGKIAKTTENPAIKYKSLKHSGLYLIFHRFSILFIDLITIHEVLPHDIGRRSDRRDRIEKRLRHPDGQHRILLSERLSAGDRIAVATSQPAAEPELHEADHERRGSQRGLDGAVGLGMIQNEGRRAADDDRQRHEPQVERNLTVGGHPAAYLRY